MEFEEIFDPSKILNLVMGNGKFTGKILLKFQNLR
jgi:hypothetical protein